VLRGSQRLVVVAFLLLGGVPSARSPNLTGFPNSMASLGDSITRAFNTGRLPFTDAPKNSWSSGTRSSVESHYLRILDAEPAIRGRNHNLAVSGAKVVGLEAQVDAVSEQGVAYITILVGANDLCTRTASGMTSVEEFRSRFESAMAKLSEGSPRARIYVLSIPNVHRLWLILKDSLLARLAWRTIGVCRSLLEDPRSTDADDVARRRAVRQRAVAFNTELAEVCALYIHCRSDDGAVFDDPFTAEDVSGRDYFHPSVEGQRRLAQLTWAATFDFTDQVAPTSTATAAPVEGGTLVSIDADDDVGVAGVEYRLNLGSWQRYGDPFVLAAGSNIRFRAVDVNGNIEPTHSFTG
jgi:lysophospholipase L1-like esterase